MADQQGHDLSGIAYTGGSDHSDDLVAIVVSKWNDKITNALYEGARETLLAAGVAEEAIVRMDVPGSYELPLAAQMAMESDEAIDAVIALGVVIQGETRHFEFICNSVANGIRQVSMDYNRPVIFGVLTPDTEQQALDRAGGKYGNKGAEAAVAGLEMIDLQRSLGL